MAIQIADGAQPPRRWPVGETLAEQKTERTLHTPAEVARARDAVKRVDWGKAELARVVAVADGWAAQPDEVLWNLVLPTTVPRRHYVNQLKGCPVHGTEIKKADHFHPWRIDPLHHPWKIQCPVGGEWYPSNDFAAGQMAGGPFPDDGFAYRAPDGEHYYFLAEYAERVHLYYVRPALAALARAYLLTSERRYAHKAAVLLFRLAEEYGHMASAWDDRARCDCGYPRVRPRDPLTTPNGNGWVGFFTDRIWENEGVGIFATAYDDLYDGIEGDAGLLSFLREQREKTLASPLGKVYAHLSEFPVPADAAGYRRFIEENLLRVLAQGILDKAILGNDGMHQSAMLKLALVLNYRRCRELVDWVYTGPGQMQFHLANFFFKDGSAYESLGGYNSIHIAGLNEVTAMMERLRALRPDLYTPDRYPRITEAPKHKLLFDFPLRTVTGDRYYPIIGDTAGPPSTARAGLRWSSDDLDRAGYALGFRLYHDPDYARALFGAGGPLPLHDPFAEDLEPEVKAIVKGESAPFPRASDVLDGYGLAILRSGDARNRRALSLFYGQPRGHAHDDFLHLDLVAQDLSVAQCLGYPRSWHYSRNWETNWITHNRVGVLGSEGVHLKGAARLLVDTPGLKLAEAEGLPYREDAGDPFHRWQPAPGNEYRRMCALVDVSPEAFYVVDIFRVAGGREHYWAFHGLGEPTAQGLALSKQPAGTLAGPGVAYGDFAAAQGQAPACFTFLEDVQRARPDGSWGVTWRLGDERDVRLKFTMLPTPDTEAILAAGRSPSGGAPYRMELALAHRSGAAPLASQFVSVLEAFPGAQPTVRSIEALPVEGGAGSHPPVALKITTAERVDYLFAATGDAPLRCGDFTFQGEYGLWSERGGEFLSATLVNGTVLSRGGRALRSPGARPAGEVIAVDRQRGAATVAGLAVGSVRPGQFVRLVNANREGFYRVLGIEKAPAGITLRLDQDALIGEGDATGFRDGVVESATYFPLASCRYYHGAHLEAPDGKAHFAVASVTGTHVYLDPSGTPAARLRAAFGQGGRFRIYDYGVGDRVLVPVVAELRAAGQ